MPHHFEGSADVRRRIDYFEMGRFKAFILRGWSLIFCSKRLGDLEDRPHTGAADEPDLAEIEQGVPHASIHLLQRPGLELTVGGGNYPDRRQPVSR